MSRTIVVYAADAGSVPRNRFGWARASSAFPDVIEEGDDIEALGGHLAKDVLAGSGVALGFECPLFVPVPAAASNLGKARRGEVSKETGNKAFSGSIGACAAMTGWVELGWLLRGLKTAAPRVRGSLVWADVEHERADVFLWEAFISGSEKGSGHSSDAAVAVRSFVKHRSAVEEATRVTAELPFSMAGALLLWADLASDLQLLHRAIPVLRGS